MSRKTIGLVGVGKIAIDQHLPSIEETGLFDLVALVSQRGITRPGIPTFRTQGEMLAAFPDLDAVANCTPPEVRPDMALEAIAAGKHLLIEKPPAASLAEFEAMRAAAEEGGRTLFATWHSRFNRAVAEAMARLGLARIRRIDIVWKEDVRRWHPGQEWIFEPGGFGVFDPAINALSILTEILPFPAFVSRATLAFPANRATPIAADVLFKAPASAGVEAITGAFDWRQEGEQTWTIRIETRDGPLLELTHGGTKLKVDGALMIDEADQEYRAIYRRFADLIDRGASDVDPAPLRLVADAYLLGRREVVDAFAW